MDNYATRYQKDRRLSDYVTEQKCLQCGEILPLTAYHRSRRKKSGYDSVCADCRSGKKEEAELHLGPLPKGPVTVDYGWMRCTFSAKEYQRREAVLKLREARSEPQQDGLAGKVCGHCKTLKPLDQFHNSNRSQDGLSANCRICANEDLQARRLASLAKKVVGS